MSAESDRRNFLLGGTAVAGGLLAGSAAAQDKPPGKDDHAGHGGANDRGKLTAGRRKPGDSPVPVETPDVPKLKWEMKDGAKEFHLHVQHLKREFLPDMWFDVWGFNGSMPGPTIEVVEGDKVRIIVHNELPEPTTMHWHGIEVPIAMDGVPGLTQDPIMPGKTFTYEFTLRQNGTFFYHVHGAMQEGMGLVGLFVIHPKEAWSPTVDRDFGLVLQEWAILPAATIPNTSSMEFNFFTVNGRSAPYMTPMVVRLGDRVRIRIVNFSVIDHHPMHLHGLTFWITGTEAGRIPETAWIPSNNVLVAVAQARDIEFVANNPGDWVMHCHMFHHMMNHMTSMVGPMNSHMKGPGAGGDMPRGMGMPNGGHALSSEFGPKLGRGTGENTGEDRAVRTGPQPGQPGMPLMPSQPKGHEGHGAPGKIVPGFPQDMGMMEMYTPAQVKKLRRPETRGMRTNWFHGVEGLMTVVRVLPPDLYDKVVSGKGEVPDGASVPGAAAGGHEGHDHPKK
jgi:FtsP/CotA-like multicopper oxidase with cupredoxin domain